MGSVPLELLRCDHSVTCIYQITHDFAWQYSTAAKTMSVKMKNGSASNFKKVEAVERHPCLYNYETL
jgi:putative lipase involved disintegration of autophagic bodies